MWNCIKNCFKTEKEVDLDIPDHLDKKAMDESGFDYYYYGKGSKDEFIFLLKFISNDQISGYSQKDLEYIDDNINELLYACMELLKKEKGQRVGSCLVTDGNIYDLIRILLEVKKYQKIA